MIRTTYVIQEFSTGVTFNIVSIKIAPSELYVNPAALKPVNCRCVNGYGPSVLI